jgi:hypothetical protein
MVGDAKTLAHGDRIILGAFATYVGIFIDTAHTKRALFKSSSSSSSLNLLEDVLCFRQSIAEEKEEEEQEQGLEVGLLSPSNNSHDRLEDIIESMDLSITDALREMMFANTMTQPSPQTPLTTVTTTPKATEAVKNKLVGEISMARQQMLEANSIAASLMVDIRFCLQVKSVPIDVPEDPALFGDLNNFITYDKFEVCFQCFANLPVHSSAASHGFSSQVTCLRKKDYPHFVII